MEMIQKIYSKAISEGREVYKEYFTSKKMVKSIVDFDIMAFKYVPDEYKTINFCLYACQKNVYAYLFVPEEYKTNRRILYAVLSRHGSMLEYCPKWVKSRKEFVMIAAKNDISSLRFASPNVFKDKNFAKEIVQYKPIAIKYFPKFKNDVDVCKNILNLNPELKPYVGNKVLENYDNNYFGGVFLRKTQ